MGGVGSRLRLACYPLVHSGGLRDGGGAETVFFARIVSAWLLLTALVGYRNVLDAGCLYMLVSLGIVVIVDLAGQAQIPLPI